MYLWFFKICCLQGSVKCLMRVSISFKTLVGWSATEDWGSSHKDEQNISSLNEPTLFLMSAMKISMEVDLRIKAELRNS